MKILSLVTLLCLLVVAASAQDPLKTLPKNYKLLFANDWVQVVRVHYPPKARLAAHEHTPTASAYVYLNDGGPVVFNHIDKEYGAVTRAATKAGSFRVYRGLQELHEVENKSDLPSDFLRVEFKTDPKVENTLRGKFFREAYPAGENFQKVQFENEQVRITRLVCAAGKTLDISTTASEPSLLIALTPARFNVSSKAAAGRVKNAKAKLALGEPRFVAVNRQEQLANVGDAPAEMLRFDFKTPPLPKSELEKKKKHEHPKN